MKIIEISRSFSAKKQLAQYEPIEIFSSYKAEVDEKDDIEKVSHELYKRAMDDVGRDLSDALYDKWLAGKTKGYKAVQKDKELGF